MATLITDLDGTVFEFQTNKFLPEALKRLLEFKRAGHAIIFITNRSGDESTYGQCECGPSNTMRVLRGYFPECSIIFGSPSPRILANDFNGAFIHHETNAPFDHDLVELAEKLGGPQ